MSQCVDIAGSQVLTIEGERDGGEENKKEPCGNRLDLEVSG